MKNAFLALPAVAAVATLYPHTIPPSPPPRVPIPQTKQIKNKNDACRAERLLMHGGMFNSAVELFKQTK